MRVAFYAPMKPPTSAVPSGDRRLARLLMTALERAGCEVALASRFCSRDGAGDPARQLRLARLGARLAARLTERLGRGRRPQAWFTYHLYHKAPDHLGPAVADALGIPYVVAEASIAPRRARGPWAPGHRAAARAVARADAVLSLNPDDDACVAPLLRAPDRLARLAPFVETAPFAAAAADRPARRAALARRHGLDPAVPWLVTAAMMRPGDKAASYALLAAALRALGPRPWHLLVAGDGAARGEVLATLAAAVPGRFTAAGLVPGAALPGFLAAGDMFVWPALREAWGMALLEAQAAGLPVVAGARAGIRAIVREGTTALLAPEGDAAALAAQAAALLDAPGRRAAMATAASAHARAGHDIAGAARTLGSVLARLRR